MDLDKVLKKLVNMPEDVKERLRREEEALAEAKAVPPEVDMIADDAWVARRNGLLGVGRTAEGARLDLDHKTTMQMRKPPDPNVADLMERIREAKEEAARKVFEEWQKEQGEAQ